MILVPVSETRDVIPAALKERDAARYVGLGIRRFRDAVHSGEIKARVRGKQRIYLTSELDEYLHSLPHANNLDGTNHNRGGAYVRQES